MTTPEENPKIVDWFPGVKTGPRVAIHVTPQEIDLLPRMIDQIYTFDLYDVRAVMRDLNVRLGAIQELTGDDPAEPVKVPLQPDEYQTLHNALRYYRHDTAERPAAIFTELFVALDRRFGAYQIRRIGQGDLTPEEMSGIYDNVEASDEDWPSNTAPPAPATRRRWGRRY